MCSSDLEGILDHLKYLMYYYIENFSTRSETYISSHRFGYNDYDSYDNKTTTISIMMITE